MEKIKFRSAHFYTKNNYFSHFSYWGMIDHKGTFDSRCFSSPSLSNMTYRKFEDQFTGLTDKNDKEIYENDIVFNHGEEGMSNANRIEYQLGKFVLVQFDNSLYPNYKEVIIDLMDCIFDLEVTGNVYEQEKDISI